MMVCQIERQVRTDCSAALSHASVPANQQLVFALPGGPRHPAAGSVKFSLRPQRQTSRARRWESGTCYCFRALPILQLDINHQH